MPIFFALIGIAVAAIVIGLSFIILNARGSSITKRQLPMRYHVAFNIAFTAALISLWFVYDLSLAILPAVMVPVWVTLLTRNKAATPNRKILFASLFVGTVLLVVGIGTFWFVRS